MKTSQSSSIGEIADQAPLPGKNSDPIAVMKAANEDLKCEKKKRKLFSVTQIAWKVFKWIIFIICTVFFFYQALEFYSNYYTYPTTNNIAITNPSHLKLPAVTICNLNMINRTYFCSRYPHLCAKPNNLEEFCQKQPAMCVGNISELEIPRLGYYTNTTTNITTEIRNAFQQLTFDADLKEKDILFKRTRRWMITYVHAIQSYKYARCYSYNLHIFDKEEPTTVESSRQAVVLGQLYEKKEESIYPWYEPQVFLAVHSPVVPVNPIYHGHNLKGGNNYEIYLHFEEEHLLPHPYPTNCTDYDALWRRNNKTGPRSQEMCRDLCRKTYEEQCIGCEMFQEMHSFKWQNFCPYEMVFCRDEELIKKIDICQKNCKPNCVKLKYTYMLNARSVSPWSIRGQFHIDQNMILVSLRMNDRDVTVVSHVPLYNEWELFSYIGGLMGCWLGISVWAFVGIIENTFRKIIKLKMA